MATVQEKTTSKKTPATEQTLDKTEVRDKIVRFDDPTPLPHDAHEDDGAPSLTQQIVMVNVVVLPIICLLYTSDAADE